MSKEFEYKILVTGATGFVGKTFCLEFKDRNIEVYGTIRSSEQIGTLPGWVKPIVVESIDGNTDWKNHLDGIDVVVHLAARVHIKKEKSLDPLAEFRFINTEGTEKLALAAVSSGVKRFIFMSTIGVNGKSSGDKNFCETDNPSPHNMYSLSKYEAEKKLLNISKSSKMKVVCLRAPLLYGPRDPGNFLTLIKAVDLGFPLPIKGVKNRKSLLYVENLTSALYHCVLGAERCGVYVISDGEDVSTENLVKSIGKELGVSVKLFYLPLWLARFLSACVGRLYSFEQLISTLTVNSSRIKNDLNWVPPFKLNEGLKKTIEWYKNTKERNRE